MRGCCILFFNHANNFGQLIHELGSVLKTACRIYHQNIDIIGFGFLDRVINKTRRVRIKFSRHDFCARSLAPNCQLFNSGGAECITRGNQDLFAFIMIAFGNFAQCCRFTRPIDANK